MADEEDLLAIPPFSEKVRSASLLTTLPILVKELHYTLIRLRDSFRLETLPHLGDAYVDMPGFAPVSACADQSSRTIPKNCFQFVFRHTFGERDGKDTRIILSAKL